jgi:hypothetical protein
MLSNNLPAELSSFVDRQREEREFSAVHTTTRLFTVTGLMDDLLGNVWQQVPIGVRRAPAMNWRSSCFWRPGRRSRLPVGRARHRQVRPAPRGRGSR